LNYFNKSGFKKFESIGGNLSIYRYRSPKHKKRLLFVSGLVEWILISS